MDILRKRQAPQTQHQILSVCLGLVYFCSIPQIAAPLQIGAMVCVHKYAWVGGGWVNSLPCHRSRLVPCFTFAARSVQKCSVSTDQATYMVLYRCLYTYTCFCFSLKCSSQTGANLLNIVCDVCMQGHPWTSQTQAPPLSEKGLDMDITPDLEHSISSPGDCLYTVAANSGFTAEWKHHANICVTLMWNQ